MLGRRGLCVVGAMAVGLAAALGVHPGSAAPIQVEVTSNATYSCLVSQEHSVNVYGSVTLPPQDGKKQPGLLTLTTGTKTIVKNGVTTTVAQLGLGARKHSIQVDQSSCARVKHQIPLEPKGLHSPTTATKNLFGHISVQCGTGSHVLVHLMFKTKAGVPTHALLAVRNGDSNRRPLAFYNWTPTKVVVYSAASCSQTQ